MSAPYRCTLKHSLWLSHASSSQAYVNVSWSSLYILNTSTSNPSSHLTWKSWQTCNCEHRSSWTTNSRASEFGFRLHLTLVTFLASLRNLGCMPIHLLVRSVCDSQWSGSCRVTLRECHSLFSLPCYHSKSLLPSCLAAKVCCKMYQWNSPQPWHYYCFFPRFHHQFSSSFSSEDSYTECCF